MSDKSNISGQCLGTNNNLEIDHKKVMLEKKDLLEIVEEMYFSKNWVVSDVLKKLTVPEINDLLLYTLYNIKDVNIKEYNELGIHIKSQLNQEQQSIYVNSIYEISPSSVISLLEKEK
jgi:hypothetical protein